MYFPKSTLDANWQEDSKIAYKKIFKNGIRTGYNHLLPIDKYKFYKVIIKRQLNMIISFVIVILETVYRN